MFAGHGFRDCKQVTFLQVFKFKKYSQDHTRLLIRGDGSHYNNSVLV